ncbi:MAG: LysR family transcriptional regulator [Pelagimonas sp.]|jgi:LysR family glycine cleavage system transcriptional activator|nr:LysR family transcriptional regulator [Pelagimonas sp.]
MDWHEFPPLTALRAFHAYANKGSVEKAGQALSVSHAAISQQIRTLESHLNIPLLDRTSRPMRMTDAGEALSKSLTMGFGEIARCIETLTDQGSERPIQISVTPSFASSWLMPRLPSWREKHPDISLMIDPSPRIHKLEPGGIDIAIRYGNGDWPGLEAEPLIASPIVVVAAPSLVGNRTFETPEDLRHLHWLQELGTSETTTWLAQSGITEGPSAGLTNLPGHLMLEAARQGQGIAIAAKLFVEQDLKAGRLRVLFEHDLGKSYHIVTRPGPLRPAVKSLCHWLRRQVKSDPLGFKS